MDRDEKTGVVIVDQDRCVGCWTCIMVCPFGAVASGRDKKVAYKCDACHEEEEAACVVGCPTGALIYCEPAELVSMKRRGWASKGPAARRARRRAVMTNDR